MEKKLDLLLKEIRTVKKDVAAMEPVLRQAAANAALVVEGYHQHGTRIEELQRLIERLRVKCPLLRLDTAEFEKVCGEVG